MSLVGSAGESRATSSVTRRTSAPTDVVASLSELSAHFTCSCPCPRPRGRPGAALALLGRRGWGLGCRLARLLAEDPRGDVGLLLAGVVELVGAADVLQLRAVELVEDRPEARGLGAGEGVDELALGVAARRFELEQADELDEALFGQNLEGAAFPGLGHGERAGMVRRSLGRPRAGHLRLRNVRESAVGHTLGVDAGTSEPVGDTPQVGARTSEPVGHTQK